MSEDFCNDKEMFEFINYSRKSKYFNDSNKLVVDKVKNETRSAVFEEYVGLKQKMSQFWVDSNSKNKK